MNPETTKKWFRRHIATRQRICWIGAPLGFIAGLAVVFFTFWFTYFVIFLADSGFNELIEIFSGHARHLSHNVRLIMSGVFIVLLFVTWARRAPWQNANSVPVRNNEMVNEFAKSQGVEPFGRILSNPQTSASIVAQLLYFGPHLILGSWNLIREARQLGAVDQAVCASAMELLANRPGRVTQQEFAEASRNLDWQEVRAGLTSVSGILISDNAMQMTDELREELS